MINTIQVQYVGDHSVDFTKDKIYEAIVKDNGQNIMYNIFNDSGESREEMPTYFQMV